MDLCPVETIYVAYLIVQLILCALQVAMEFSKSGMLLFQKDFDPM